MAIDYPLSQAATATSLAWWKEKTSVHQAVFASAEFLRANQEYKSIDNMHNLRLYSNYECAGLSSNKYGRPSPGARNRDKLTLNVCRSLVDTVHARTIQNKPKPTFLTTGGDFSAQRKAKLCDRLVAGMFYHSKMYDIGQEVCKDALIFGTGAVKIYPGRDGKPKAERVFIDEIDIDEAEGMLRKPRQMFHRRAVDREAVLARWPKYRQKIINASLPDSMNKNRRDSLADQVMVIESWHLPSEPGADDGRHVVAVNTATLVDEPWEYDYFPFVFLRWQERPVGFFGQGIVEQASGTQWEINQLLQKAQLQMRLSGPKVYLERGSSVNPAHIDNEIWGVVEYSGNAPTHSVFDAVEPTLLSHLEWLLEKSYQDVGVSQMAAQQQKPAGLNSGKALLTYNDLQDTRFIFFGQGYENLFLESADRHLDIARATHMKPDPESGEAKPFEVMSLSPRMRGRPQFLETINWGDIDIAKDEYQVQVFPTSMMPNTPSGKLQFIGEMIDRGMLQGDQALALLDYPDTDKVVSLVTAPLDDVDMLLENMLDKGEYIAPDAYTNLKLATERMTSGYLRAKIQGYPDDCLERVGRYLSEAQQLLNPPPPLGPPAGLPQPAMGPGAAAAGMPGAPALPQGMQLPPAALQGAPGSATPPAPMAAPQ